MKIRNIIMSLIGITTVGAMMYSGKKSIDKSEDLKMRFKNYYDVTNQWLKVKNDGNSLEEYFTNNNYSNVAIYGLGEMGSRLYEELKDSNINIGAFIDSNAGDMYYGEEIDIIDIDQVADKAFDVIVITPIYAYDEIESKLINAGVECEIVSLEDVVFEI